ncbi:hypothetical protein DV532_30025 (plasmid) [Pseudomonas sp. Leaf58]|nr:hypothetical protein DV532_30025 [Pseudomonas sp. Leaf58]KQN61988.1 hypothetical protein ASF02_07305 [Pseudomonas sp. Leaf58]
MKNLPDRKLVCASRNPMFVSRSISAALRFIGEDRGVTSPIDRRFTCADRNCGCAVNVAIQRIQRLTWI